jgi:tetratricopeptide (TPR) repeat protein
MERPLLAVVFTLVCFCFAISPALGAENAADEHYKRELALEEKGERDKAIAEFNEAIRLDSRNALAYKGRGAAWGHKGEYDRAMNDFNEAGW